MLVAGLFFTFASGMRLVTRHRDLSNYSPACQARLRDIRPSDSNWHTVAMAGSDDLVYEKSNCGQVTWDVLFCTRVCVLGLDEPCVVTPEPGFDRCRDDLVCSPVAFGSGNTCQRPTEDYSDYSSIYDDSSFEDFFFFKKRSGSAK